VVGAGPSGMSMLVAFKSLGSSDHGCELTCYEQQSDWGGMWNYMWKRGTDENGERSHSSMY